MYYGLRSLVGRFLRKIGLLPPIKIIAPKRKMTPEIAAQIFDFRNLCLREADLATDPDVRRQFLDHARDIEDLESSYEPLDLPILPDPY